MVEEQEMNVKNVIYVQLMPFILLIIYLLILQHLLIFFISLLPMLFIILPTMIMLILILGRDFQFIRFRFDENGMVFLSRHSRILRRTLAFRIAYEDIVRIHLTDQSLYSILYNPRKPKHYVVPHVFIRHPENEKTFLESLTMLKTWYLSHGHTKIIFDPPDHYYSKKKDVWALRKKDGKVVFAMTGGGILVP